MAAEAFERRIPSPVRLEAGRSAARVFARIRRNAVISASHTVREDGTMAVRNRREGELGTMTLDQLVEKMRFEVDNKII